MCISPTAGFSCITVYFPVQKLTRIKSTCDETILISFLLLIISALCVSYAVIISLILDEFGLDLCHLKTQWRSETSSLAPQSRKTMQDALLGG